MIFKYPNEILRKTAKPVKKIDLEIKKIAEKLTKEMKKNEGAGLAANQIGELKRIIAYLDSNKAKVLINPVIVKKSKKEIESEEGCLSFPNLFGRVVRSEKIKVQAINLSGKKITVKAKNILAIILQHEIDHLDGILFIDKAIPGSLHKVKPTKEPQNVK